MEIEMTTAAKAALDKWAISEASCVSLRVRTVETLVQEGWNPSCFQSPKAGGALAPEAWETLVSQAIFIVGGQEAVTLQATPAKSLADYQKEWKRENRQRAGSVIRDLKRVFLTRWTALHGEPEKVEGETGEEKTEGAEKVNVGKADFADRVTALAFFKELESRLMEVETQQYPIERVLDLVVEIQGVISNSKAKRK